jgi:hypothetical protein
MTTWTDPMIERLRRMHAAGCTDDEIALAMQTSPRAVNGKRWRLGLTVNLDDPLVIVMRRLKRELIFQNKETARTRG